MASMKPPDVKNTYLRTEELETSIFLAVSTRSSFLGFWDVRGTEGTVSTRQGNLSVE